MYLDEVDHLLAAAVRLKDSALELDGDVDPVLRAACQHLAEAVYGWQEWDTLRQELEGEDVWSGAVFDVGAGPQATGNYAEHVERVVASANQVFDITFGRAVLTIPEHALPAVDAVVTAVAEHRELGTSAQARWLEGERPTVVAGGASSMPEEPPTPPDDIPPMPDGPGPGTRARARLDDGASLGLAPAALPHRASPMPWSVPTPPRPHGPRP